MLHSMNLWKRFRKYAAQFKPDLPGIPALMQMHIEKIWIWHIIMHRKTIKCLKRLMKWQVQCSKSKYKSLFLLLQIVTKLLWVISCQIRQSHNIINQHRRTSLWPHQVYKPLTAMSINQRSEVCLSNLALVLTKIEWKQTHKDRIDACVHDLRGERKLLGPVNKVLPVWCTQIQ